MNFDFQQMKPVMQRDMDAVLQHYPTDLDHIRAQFLTGGDAYERKRVLVEFARRTGNTVFVSDYIYSEAREFDETTECYRRTLAMLDRTLAAECDQVVEVTFGMKYLYK